MTAFPMRRTYIVSVRGQRYGSIQTTDTRNDEETLVVAQRYAREVKAKFAVNDPEGAESVKMRATVEPDHYLEGQAMVDADDR